MMPSHNRRTLRLHALGFGGLRRRAVVLGRHVDNHAPLQDVEDHLVLLEEVLVWDDRLGELTKPIGMLALSTSAASDLMTCTIWSAPLQLSGVQNQAIFSRYGECEVREPLSMPTQSMPS